MPLFNSPLREGSIVETLEGVKVLCLSDPRPRGDYYEIQVEMLESGGGYRIGETMTFLHSGRDRFGSDLHFRKIIHGEKRQTLEMEFFERRVDAQLE